MNPFEPVLPAQLTASASSQHQYQKTLAVEKEEKKSQPMQSLVMRYSDHFECSVEYIWLIAIILMMMMVIMERLLLVL